VEDGLEAVEDAVYDRIMDVNERRVIGAEIRAPVMARSARILITASSAASGPGRRPNLRYVQGP
jgi:hypothetical protein